MPTVEVFTPQGMEEMGFNMKELMSQIMPKKTRHRKVKIPEAIEILIQEEAAHLVDMEEVAHEAISRAEQFGIVFIDEIDKIAGREAATAPTSRARACSATCCRSSKARPSTPSTARCAPTISCSSPRARFTPPSPPT